MKQRLMKRKMFAMLLAAGYAGCMLAGCNLFKDEKEDPIEEVFNKNLLNLSLTEIHYNPADGDVYSSDSLEFLEIKNVGSSALTLATLEISGDVTYSFSEESSIDAGEFYIVASNAAAFEAQYGSAPDGIYIGQLDNSNGTVTLRDADFKEVIFSQFYSDSGSWSGKADGDGYSLVNIEIDPDRTNTGPEAWRKSARINGSPGDDDIIIPVDSSLFNIKISEIHYNPLAYDVIDGDSLEFIELKNIGSETVDLSRLGFTNGIKYTFPADSKLEAGKILVLAAVVSEFSKRYPEVTPFGQYSGQLSNTGEKVTLFDLLGDAKITSVNYNDNSPWPSMADGDGGSLVAVSLNRDVDQNDPTQWRVSYRPNGSPGGDDPGVVIINELLTHTDTPLVDAVELFNPGTKSVNIGGWYLSDSKADPAKYQIAEGVEIAAGGYLVLDEKQFNADTTNPLSFTLNSHGESVWLFSHELGCTEGYCDGVSFGEIDNGVSIGRYRTTTGKESFVRQAALTLGEENAGPRVGPLVISEIMYHSQDDAGDYIEVTNTSGGEIFFSNNEVPEHTWKISGANFKFPAGASIKPNESVVIASDSLSIEAFRTRYSIDAAVQVFQMSGDLQNGSEKIELGQPADPYIDDNAGEPDTINPFVTIDKVDYSDQKPWPSLADGGGKSLHRVPLSGFGNDVDNWIDDNPSPGM